MVHVLVGSNDDDFAAIVEAGQAGGSVNGWVVPKTAGIGDSVIMFTRSKGFVGRGAVASALVPATFGKKQVHRADVGPITLFPAPVPLAYVSDRLPDWGWATYPRSYTTPPAPIVEALEAAFDDFHRDLGPLDGERAQFSEGRSYHDLGLRYERDPAARAACIQHYGTACDVC